MATFKKTLKDGSIVEFDIASYEELTGSAALSGRRRLISNTQRVPFQLQRGDQSNGFKSSDIAAPNASDPVIIKLDENLNYAAMPKVNYQSRMQRIVLTAISGANARRGIDIPVSVYNSITASISASIVNLPETVLFLAEDTGFTGSYTIQESGSDNFAYSGIATTSGIDRIILNSSPTATGASWSFAHSASTFVDGVNGNEFHQNEYTSSFIIRTYGGYNGVSGSYIGQVGAIQSQSRVDSGKFYNYKYHTPSSSKTGSVENTSTAGYYRTVLKANVFGDGNETLFSASFNDPANAMYAADREILTFPWNTVVASGAFWWCNKFESLVGVNNLENANYQPIRRVTLYWASGSGGIDDVHGLSGSITPNVLRPDTDAIQGIESGSHIFLNDKLTVPASGGYYTTTPLANYPDVWPQAGVESVWYNQFTASIDRIKGGLPISGTVHVAGNGMRGLTPFGSEYFQTPFVDAHEQTSSILPAATRWNGISFSNHGGGGSYGTGELNPGDYDDSGDN